jgi:hypothetical protein
VWDMSGRLWGQEDVAADYRPSARLSTSGDRVCFVLRKMRSPPPADEGDIRMLSERCGNGDHERSGVLPDRSRISAAGLRQVCGRLVTRIPRCRMSNGAAHPSPRSAAVQDNPGVWQGGIRNHRMRASYQPIDRHWGLIATPQTSKRRLAI